MSHTSSRSRPGYPEFGLGNRTVTGPDGAVYYREGLDPDHATTASFLQVWLVLNTVRIAGLALDGYLLAHSHGLMLCALEVVAGLGGSKAIDRLIRDKKEVG